MRKSRKCETTSVNIIRHIQGYRWLMAYLRNPKQFGSVAFFPVSQFVAEYGGNLFGVALFNQGIVNDNVLAPGKAIEVGVAVCAPLRPVDDIEMFQRELEPSGKRFNLIPQFSRFQRSKLVEHWQNDERIDGDHESLNEQHEHPCIVEEVETEILHNLQKPSEDRASENGNEELSLDEIHHELYLLSVMPIERHLKSPYQFLGLFIEPKFLFEYKSLVIGQRKADGACRKGEHGEEDNGLRDLPREAKGGILSDQMAGKIPELGEQIKMDGGDIGDLAEQRVDEGEIGFGASVGLRSIAVSCGLYVPALCAIPELCRNLPEKQHPRESLVALFRIASCAGGMRCKTLGGIGRH